MKIAFYYPSQDIVAKDLLFCKYTGHEFLHMSCDESVDVIYAASISVLQQALDAKERFGKRLVCWVWDIPYNWKEWQMSNIGMSENSFRDNLNESRVSLLRKCDLVISGSKWTQGILRDIYNIPSEQIYFYIDTESIDRIPAQNREKQIIQISRYFYNKKFENTIIATRDITDYKTILIGSGLNSSYGESLMKYANIYNKNVVFNGILSREDVVRSIKRSTILVSPSVFEGWGITPIEALYCETPVLLSDLEVFKEQYGDNVLYHRRNDVDDMKEKLEYLVSDKDLQRRIVEKCKPIISEFTPQKFAYRWNRVINKL